VFLVEQEERMPITITVTGADGNDVLQQYCDFIEAMNHRVAVEKLKIEAKKEGVYPSPKGPEVFTDTQINEAPKRRGRPPKEIATRDVEAETVEAEKVNGKTPTREAVIIALNKYAESHGGQVAGREVMKQVCGVTRLVDCTPGDYQKLLDALGA
jgi:hypothetical protein